jgi:hypothetical protein
MTQNLCMTAGSFVHNSRCSAAAPNCPQSIPQRHTGFPVPRTAQLPEPMRLFGLFMFDGCPISYYYYKKEQQ